VLVKWGSDRPQGHQPWSFPMLKSILVALGVVIAYSFARKMLPILP
jgi:hypothetical protein